MPDARGRSNPIAAVPAYRPQRILEAEELDNVPAREAETNLLDMARINRLFGGFGILRRQVRGLAENGLDGAILDVAAGSTQTAGWLRRAMPGTPVVSTDLRQDLLGLGDGPRVAADALHLPFACGSFAVVISTLFLHHLSGPALAQAMGEMLRVSRVGVVAVDLLRHPLAYHFLRHTRPLFGWHRLTIEDGQRSVQAAFTRAELQELLVQSGFTGAKVRVHHPWFRLSVVLPKGQPAGAVGTVTR